ncbi:MAG: substrate-binding domain-containing protein, partial [Bdellovibrionales bacterium]|nr:substrate-binding domain-containing protein [Oligoflexia bacterium]
GRKELLVNQLKAHELDLAFSNTGTSDPEIVAIQQFQLPVGLYVSTRERKKYPKKSARDFLTDPSIGFALPNFQLRLRYEIDDYLESQGIKNTVFFESDTLALVTRAVVDHVGIGFFPKPYMQEDEKLKQVVCISGREPLWHHSLYLLSHLRFEQTPVIREMILSIRKHFSIVEHSKAAK